MGADRKIALVLAVAFTFAMSEPAVAEERPRYGGTLTVALAAPLLRGDPMEENRGDDRVLGLVYDALFRLDDKGAPEPHLALSVEIGPEQPIRARVRLRHGVKFHDGRALTSADVALSLKRALASRRAWMLAPITGARAISPEVVELELSRASTTLKEALATPAAYVLPAGTLAPKHPIGTGSFRVESWGADEARLSANREHFAGRPYLDALTFKRFRSAQDERAAVELRNLDVAAIPRGDAQLVRRRDIVELESASTGIYALVPGARLASLAFKEGISAAIDRDRIRRLAIPAPSVAVPSHVDLAHARALLPPATKATLLFDDGTPWMRTAAERILADLAQAGMTVTLEPASARDFAERRADGRFDLCLAEIAIPFPNKAWQDAATKTALPHAVLLALRGERYLVAGNLGGVKLDAYGRVPLEELFFEGPK